MADQQIPGLPEGAILAPLGTAAQSAQPQAASIPGLPAGATLAPLGTAAGTPQQTPLERNQAYNAAHPLPQPGAMDQFLNASGAETGGLSTLANAAIGQVKGLAQTGVTTAKLASKIPGVHQLMQSDLPLIHHALDTEHLNAADQSTTPTNAAQKVGYGGESLAEFLIPGGEVGKAVGWTAKTLADSSKIMGVLEKSPKAIQAMKIGAAALQDAAKLGPAEKALVAAHPWLARFIPVVGEAIAAGTTAGAAAGAKATAEHTPEAPKPQGLSDLVAPKPAPEEGSFAELGQSLKAGTGAGLEEGVKTGLMTAGLGGALAGAGGLLSKVAGGFEKGGAATVKSADAVTGATKAAETAPASQSIADTLKSHLEDANKQMHSDFESKINKVAENVPNTVPLHETPLVQTAKDLLKAEKPANKGALTRSGEALEPLSDKAKNLLKPLVQIADEAATNPEAAEQVGVKELIEYRQQVRAASAKLDWNAPEKDIYKKVMDSIDDTIQDMADKSGNPGAASDYKAARADYKNEVKNFSNTDVKAFMAGDKGGPSQIADITSRLNRGETAANDLKVLRKTVGDDAMNKVSDQMLQRTMADSQTNGRFDPKIFMDKVAKWPKASTAELFKDAPVDLKAAGLTPNITSGVEDGTSWAQLSLTKDGDQVGSIMASTPDFDPNGLAINHTSPLRHDLRNKSIGKAMYEQVIQKAKDEGKTSLYSDFITTRDAKNVWESLAKRYNVTTIDSAGGPRYKLDLTTPRQTPLDKVVGDANNAKTIQTLVKAGLVSSGGVAGLAGAHLLGMLGPVAEAALGISGAGGAAKIMNYVANHPQTWAILRTAGRAAETAGKVAGKVANAVPAKAIPKVVGAEMGTRNKQNMMTDLASSLGGGRD